MGRRKDPYAKGPVVTAEREDVTQVLLPSVMMPAFNEWLEARGMLMSPHMKNSEDDITTVLIWPKIRDDERRDLIPDEG